MVVSFSDTSALFFDEVIENIPEEQYRPSYSYSFDGHRDDTVSIPSFHEKDESYQSNSLTQSSFSPTVKSSSNPPATPIKNKPTPPVNPRKLSFFRRATGKEYPSPIPTTKIAHKKSAGR